MGTRTPKCLTYEEKELNVLKERRAKLEFELSTVKGQIEELKMEMAEKGMGKKIRNNRSLR